MPQVLLHRLVIWEAFVTGLTKQLEVVQLVTFLNTGSFSLFQVVIACQILRHEQLNSEEATGTQKAFSEVSKGVGYIV